MLTLICGLPNAGKTTFSKRYDNVIHLDDVKPQGKAPTKVIHDLVAEQGDVCVEGTYLVARQRRELAKAYNGERKVCIWLDTPYEECIARENRGRSNALFRFGQQAFEPPTISEGWDEIIRITNYECNRTKRET